MADNRRFLNDIVELDSGQDKAFWAGAGDVSGGNGLPVAKDRWSDPRKVASGGDGNLLRTGSRRLQDWRRPKRVAEFDEILFVSKRMKDTQ